MWVGRRERMISYIVEKHMEAITLFGWMKPRTQVKYAIFKNHILTPI
jgi:hypothetical protein